MTTTSLYRPVGKKELALIKATDYQKFPPRLVGQPFFYPVMNEAYAAQIAEEWNTKDEFSGYCGFVTKFEVETDYLKQFKVENVGGFMHNELWIPAEELETFNSHMVGNIEVIQSFYGIHYQEIS